MYKANTDILPSGWKYDYLDKYARRGSGHTPTKNVPQYWNGGILWVSLADSFNLDKGLISKTQKEISDEGVKNSSAVVHPARTVILSRDAGVGKSAIIASPMAVSQHFMAWQCDNKEKINSWFLYNYLQLMKPEFERQAVGSTIKTIGLPYFKDMKILIPPYKEQEKIGEILSVWDQAIFTTEKILKNKKIERLEIANSLLSGKRRFNGFSDWKNTLISSLITESRIQGTNGNIAKKLTIKLYGQGIHSKNEKRLGSESTKYFRRLAGQFVYSKLDFLNGAFGIIPQRLDGYESTLDLPAFDFKESVDPLWFLRFVSRESFYLSQTSMAKGGRKARRVNPKDFLRVEVRVPSYEEQRKISEVISIADQEIDKLLQKLACLKNEKKGLMQQLLTGKARVKVEAQ